MSSENRNTSGIGNGYRTVVKIPERKKKLDRYGHKRYQNWFLKKKLKFVDWTEMAQVSIRCKFAKRRLSCPDNHHAVK
jgi:hypothetical protein